LFRLRLSQWRPSYELFSKLFAGNSDDAHIRHREHDAQPSDAADRFTAGLRPLFRGR
jgi:hypothetical protein